MLGIGWLIDLFLIPGMDRDADQRFTEGRKSFTLSWILLTFFGIFGIHRFYLEKWISGILYLFTGGLFFIGVLYDFWTLNQTVDEVNLRRQDSIG